MRTYIEKMHEHQIQKHGNAGLFKPGENCWRVSHLDYGALLVDCANFFRALHSAIVKARHNIFIVGWDIDSRIRLLRGDDEKNSPYPSVAGDLLRWKAEKNPEITIYLLRWDSSIAFIAKREIMPESVWEVKTPPNVHTWLDDTIPAGGSHHQKIIVIDDEIAFTGGMDIARERWDERSHNPVEPERIDLKTAFGPYHDIQIVTAGPLVRHFSELVRWRWRHAAGYEAAPPTRRTPLAKAAVLPACWPDGFRPHLFDMPCAVARTIPWMGEHPQRQEIKKMYLDLIGAAENFIYAENQFFTCIKIAKAMNARMKSRRDLRVLLVSSYDPQGLFEREGMWAARIDFQKTVENGIDPGRIKIAYPVIYDRSGDAFHKRIHSKIFVVDDRYCNIASSNINNRSMVIDTECDLILSAEKDWQKKDIRNIRNDLICEHTGIAMEDIEKSIRRGNISSLLDPACERGLREINDTIFTNKKLQPLFLPLADPRAPLLPSVYSLNPGEIRPMRNPPKSILLAVAALIFLATAASLAAGHADWVSPDRIKSFLELSRGTVWALPLVCGTYLVGGLTFFPVTLLSLITAAVFGPVWGPLYAMIGALLSAALLFWIGRLAGLKGIRKMIGERVRKIENKMQKKGVAGVVALRLVPVAPFSAVNLVAGISTLQFHDFIIGTFLGLLPGLIAKGIVGDSLMQLFVSPSPKTVAYVVCGIVFWLFLVIGAQKIVLRSRKLRDATQNSEL